MSLPKMPLAKSQQGSKNNRALKPTGCFFLIVGFAFAFACANQFIQYHSYADHDDPQQRYERNNETKFDSNSNSKMQGDKTRLGWSSFNIRNKKSAVTPDKSAAVFEGDEICSLFASPSSTATRLWQEYLPDIFNASKNPLIPELLTDEEDAKMHTLLEKTLTPSRMRRAVVHMPTFSHDIVKKVVEIIEKRMRDPENNPPLRIAVFGGSVTLGRGCYGRGMSNTKCAWPQRLHLLLNQFAKMDIVKVYNLAVGGTGSPVGTNMVKYWMLPEELKKAGPDVIINSYSTNDSLPRWDLKPEDDSELDTRHRLRDDALQPFIRAALQMKPCAIPPLVIHVDDNLGPQHKTLLGELTYSNTMTQLAKWYDTFGISYAEVVRDLVYHDMSDGTFFNIKDVHYGHWAHQTIAWSVGFASLDLLSVYCDDEYNARMLDRTQNTDDPSTENKTEESIASDYIRKNKLFLPPPLTRDLLSAKATEEFNAALNDAHKSYKEMDCSNSTTSISEGMDINPCIISWISSPGGYGPGQINGFLNEYSTSNNNWKVENAMGEGWGNKIGLIAEGANANFNLQFKDVSKNIKTVTFYFIRSYGEKWKDSRAKFTISRVNANESSTVLSEEEISAIHENDEYTYSLTLSQMLVLSEPIKKGETLSIKADLIAGSHFKIMGIMICNK